MREALNRGKETAKRAKKEEISTFKVNREVEKVIAKHGAEASFKNYKTDGVTPFPGSACISINNEIVHGVPRKDKLIQEGDIVKIDIGVKHKGLYTDAAISFGVGRLSEKARKIIEVTRESLQIGLRQIKPGNRLGDFGWAVENFVQSKGLFVVTDLVGHGVGRDVHEPPQVPNYGERGTGEIFKKGMVLALEPMVNEKDSGIKLASDRLTYLTRKGGLSGHFEQTIVVTEDGCKILTE